jgi:hypothetical protein
LETFLTVSRCAEHDRAYFCGHLHYFLSIILTRPLLCLQRPLKTIAIKSGDVYIPRGVSVPALDKDVLWEFQPTKLGSDLT